MNILIIGSGGREYSIGLSLHNEKQNHNLYFAPGNGATKEFATNINISDYEELANFAKKNNIELTIVGPEDPLVGGIVDVFKESNLNIFGPSREASKLEGSKIYMKNFLKEFNIPTAKFIETSDLQIASNFINTLSTPIVVKADGLCGGKGVIIANSKEKAIKSSADMLSGASFGESGKKIIIEEFLDGYELSVFALCDGEDYLVLPAAQDHKRLEDKDEGPNTGGMGTYAPTPLINDDLYAKIEETILKPTLKGMKERNAPYQGVLFMGIMVVNNTPYVIEYNVRFGDPECEVILPLIKTPISKILFECTKKNIKSIDLETNNLYAISVVLASENYPYRSSPREEITIKPVNETLKNNTQIIYAGVSSNNENKLVSNGGRVMLSVGLGSNIKEARDNAYALISHINFKGMKYRNDIAYQAL
ncbi:MAG: Phosphoribosylamine--glycine ligase (EC [uncultured Campylobacterales bacterium]|uniref:Phosphoribosylamine--glycine ligase n=1 Tax=uncultured Campylobacterales bacterium TaxID=352960 RepID=A0A6S6TFD5_9BACT|nr:MAG: Phosphoribosylamine--glycine ligase (EC [uncultured Campylobacterales bacterium]